MSWKSKNCIIFWVSYIVKILARQRQRQRKHLLSVSGIKNVVWLQILTWLKKKPYRILLITFYKFDNLNEMDKFLEKNSLPKLT